MPPATSLMCAMSSRVSFKARTVELGILIAIFRGVSPSVVDRAVVNHLALEIFFAMGVGGAPFSSTIYRNQLIVLVLQRSARNVTYLVV